MLKVALIGRANVGKSSLFNRIARKKDAIISDEAGTTRDVKKALVSLERAQIELIDSGGIEKGGELSSKISRKSIEAAAGADVLLFVVDINLMPSDEDKRLFHRIARGARHSALILNKADNVQKKLAQHDFYSLGFSQIFTTSCAHNLGIDKLTDWLDALANSDASLNFNGEASELFGGDLKSGQVLESAGDLGGAGDLENAQDPSEQPKRIKIAIVGRPNVGKSSILNALLGYERAIVSEAAGTTIDPVNESLHYKNTEFVFVDTAGIRRRSKVLGLERLGLMRTKEMLKDAALALLILDASEDFKENDEKIAGLIGEFNLGVIIVANKIDLAEKSAQELEQQVRRKFRFLEYAPFISVSAANKKRVVKILDLALRVYENYTATIPTAKLNEIIQTAMAKHHAPSYKTKRVKIFFATQFASSPPKIALVCNYPQGLHFSFLRYLKNQIREYLNFLGSPIILVPRSKGETEKE